MNEANLPPHLAIAADVTEEEFKKARLQNRATNIATFSVPILLFLYWLLVDATFLNVKGEPPYRLSIAWALIVNRVLYYSLKEGRKMKTMRIIRYQELRKLRLNRPEK